MLSPNETDIPYAFLPRLEHRCKKKRAERVYEPETAADYKETMFSENSGTAARAKSH